MAKASVMTLQDGTEVRRDDIVRSCLAAAWEVLRAEETMTYPDGPFIEAAGESTNPLPLQDSPR